MSVPFGEIRNRVNVPIRGGLAEFITFQGASVSAEHFAMGFGNWMGFEAPLVRIHSECLTGDVFRSAKCDCGEQLEESIDRVSREGGLILYLRQEGRGIGLYNKLDAYALQALGMDTFEANRALGFKDDDRNYSLAAQMLKTLGVKAVRLFTNNPEKANQLESAGIEVREFISTGVFLKAENRAYLAAKVKVSRHRLKVDCTEVRHA